MAQQSTLVLDIDATALQPILQELMYLDRTLYNATLKGLRDAAKPLVMKVKAGFPTKTLSGLMTEHKNTPRLQKVKRSDPYPVYKIARVRASVTAVAGGRKRTENTTFPVLRIRQKQGAAMIYDMAQNDAEGQTLSRNLRKMHGNASRTMYPVVRRNIKSIEKDLDAELKKAEKMVTDRILATGSSQYKASSARAKSQSRNALGKFGRLR
jgi:hypothetical protein